MSSLLLLLLLSSLFLFLTKPISAFSNGFHPKSVVTFRSRSKHSLLQAKIGDESFKRSAFLMTSQEDKTTILFKDKDMDNPGNPRNVVGNDVVQRRTFVQCFPFITTTAAAAVSLSLCTSVPGAVAIERAVGEAEKTCREKGNCLENFDIDGAVGWNWGGKDRCDASDPLCGPDGKMMETPPVGAVVPRSVDSNGNDVKMTNVVQIDLCIGKNEVGSIRLGLYGDSCPESVSQFVTFLKSGLVTTSKLMLEDGFGVSASPVSFTVGGSLTTIYPQSRLEFGIVSQALSYAKGRGLNRIPSNFVPMPRPNGPIMDAISNEKTVRPHDVAGLLSIPKNGMGYGGTGLESEDEAFANAFQITAASVPAMDRESRKVIGQVMDEDSMAFLARLASLATKKGFKGVIPGQNAGPPLIKTTITSVSVQ